MPRFESRKFFLTLLVFGVATALRIADLIDAAIWQQTVMFSTGAYLTANVTQNVKINGRVNSEGP